MSGWLGYMSSVAIVGLNSKGAVNYSTCDGCQLEATQELGRVGNGGQSKEGGYKSVGYH